MNVGSVEAVLAARDTMSTVFVAAAERVVSLRNEIKNLGDDAGPALTKLQSELSKALDQFNALAAVEEKLNTVAAQNIGVVNAQTAANAANTAAMQTQNTVLATSVSVNQAAAGSVDLVAKAHEAAALAGGKFVEANQAAGQSMTQVEGIATRLIERLLILYAIRGTFEFVKDLFTAADALVAVHEKLGLTLQLTQELKFASDNLSIPFETTTAAVDHLDKTLASAKMTTGEALRSIGLSFDEVFKLNPEDRLHAIIDAIAGFADVSVRRKAEVELFGTDAIDPLITKFKALSDQAISTGHVLNDDVIQGLANSDKAFKDAADGIKLIAGNLLYAAQNAVAFGLTPFFKYFIAGEAPNKTDIARLLTNFAMSMTPGGLFSNFLFPPESDKAPFDLNSMKPVASHGGTQADHPLFGQDFIDSLKAESQELIPLTAQQKEWMNQLVQMNELTTDNAAHLNVTNVQYKEYVKNLSDAKKEHTELNAEMRETEKNFASNQKWLDSRIDDWEREGQAEYKAVEKEIKDQQTLLDKQLADSQRRYEIEQDSLEHLQLLEDRYNQAVQQEYGTTTDIAIANIQRQADAQIKSIRDNDEFRNEEIAIIKATEAQAIQAYIRNLDPLWQAWKAGNEDMRKEWAASWLAFENDPTEKNFEKAILAPFIDIENQFKKMLAGMLSDWEQQLLSPMLSGLRRATGGLFASIGGSAAAGIGSSATSYISSDVAGVEASSLGLGAGAATGIGGSLAAGAITAGISAAAIGGYELLKYIFRDKMPEDIAKAAGTQFGEVWSDSLQQSIVKNAKQYNDEVTGIIASLPDIIKENPIDLTNLRMYEGKVHDIYSLIQTGHLTVAQGAKDLDAVFPDLATVATDAYGRIDDKLKGIIALNDTFLTQSKAIAEWQKQQGSTVLSGFNAVAQATVGDSAAAHTELATAQAALAKNPNDAAAQKAVVDAQAKVKSSTFTGNVQDVGAMAVGSFVTAVGTGTSKSDAIKSESSALTSLEQEYKRLGLTVNDTALKSLFMMNNLQIQAPTVIAGIEGLQQQIVGLDNLNQETNDGFEAQERIGSAMYDRLKQKVTELGGDAADSLIPMQDYLHIAKDEAEKLGLKLDDNTQGMIDQSKALGIWDDNAKPVKTTTEKLADAIERLVNWLDRIPPSVDTTVNTTFNDRHVDTSGTNPDEGGQFTPPLDAVGGIIPGYGFGGRVLPFRVPPGSTDTQLVGMTPGEGVLTVETVNRIGASGVTALNQGRHLAGPSDSHDNYTINLTLYTQATNGQELIEEARKPGGLIDAIIQDLHYNKRGRGTLARRAIEAA